MKEWIVLQGWPLYLMLGMTGLGLLGSILSRIFYGRLAREAQLCGTSDYPMLHYIRQKYSSYYKLGMRPGNAEALVKRYLALHRVGPLALYSWNEAGNFMMGAVMLTGLIRGIYRFQTTMQTGPALMDIGIGLVLALGLRLTGKIFSVERLQVITLNAICDYLENYLKSKLDGEYGYGPQTETPDHYARALKETAASRTKPGLRPTTVRRMPAERSETVDSIVDAKIVEDVLKEFLC